MKKEKEEKNSLEKTAHKVFANINVAMSSKDYTTTKRKARQRRVKQKVRKFRGSMKKWRVSTDTSVVKEKKKKHQTPFFEE